jgi:glycosyltransferase involved in cell wall biosynthesis
MSESIHTVRWISQIADQGWEIHLFSSTNNWKIHPDFRNITIYHGFYGYQNFRNPGVKVKGIPVGIPRFTSVIKRIVKRLSPQFRQTQLSRLISTIKPDIVHSLEFQAGGYLVMDVKKQSINKFPPWIATNWGSDIYHFIHDPAHKTRIQEILHNCDYYSCECHRDVDLAIKYGFKGKLLPVLPNAGGFDLDTARRTRESGPSSARRLILLKGYQHWAGRALVGINALYLCKTELTGYTIAIFSASPQVKRAAIRFSKETNVPVIIIPRCSYEKMLEYFGKSRIYIGLSISDGISTSLLEAMVMGAFPIQSNTACADEWIINGRSGFIVPPEDPQLIADAIKKAIKDDNLVDDAVESNYDTALNRLESNKIKERVIKIYNDINNVQ